MIWRIFNRFRWHCLLLSDCCWRVLNSHFDVLDSFSMNWHDWLFHCFGLGQPKCRPGSPADKKFEIKINFQFFQLKFKRIDNTVCNLPMRLTNRAAKIRITSILCWWLCMPLQLRSLWPYPSGQLLSMNQQHRWNGAKDRALNCLITGGKSKEDTKWIFDSIRIGLKWANHKWQPRRFTLVLCLRLCRYNWPSAPYAVLILW